MIKKLAKIKYLPNNYQIIENGDYVECAVTEKIVKVILIYFQRLCDQIHSPGLLIIIFSSIKFSSFVIFSIDVSE